MNFRPGCSRGYSGQVHTEFCSWQYANSTDNLDKMTCGLWIICSKPLAGLSLRRGIRCGIVPDLRISSYTVSQSMENGVYGMHLGYSGVCAPYSVLRI